MIPFLGFLDYKENIIIPYFVNLPIGQAVDKFNLPDPQFTCPGQSGNRVFRPLYIEDTKLLTSF